METFIFIRSMNWIERPFCAQFIISKRRKKSFKIFWNTKNWVRENGSLVFRVRRDQYQNMYHRRCCLWIEKQYGFLSMMNRMNEHEQSKMNDMFFVSNKERMMFTLCFWNVWMLLLSGNSENRWWLWTHTSMMS